MFSLPNPIRPFCQLKRPLVVWFLCALLVLPILSKAQVKHDSTVVLGVRDSLFPGQTDAKILGLAVYLSGGNDSVFCGSFRFSHKGTKQISKISEARLYYQGKSLNFDGPLDSLEQFGKKASITSSFLVFNDSLELPKGTHYFVLAYDISDSVAHLDSFSGALVSHKLAEQVISPSLSSESGKRTVSTFMSTSYCSIGRKLSGTHTAGPTQVQLGEVLNNHTSNQDGYLFFKQAVPVVKSGIYKFDVRVGPLNNHRVQAWVDWDGDGFLESDERILSQTGIPAGSKASKRIKVPCFIKPGPKRLRVVADYSFNAQGGPCDSLNQGSVEDYVLMVLEEQTPNTSFETDTTVFVGGQAYLKNTSTTSGRLIEYGWDVDDNGTIDTLTRDLSWTLKTSGYHRFTLKATLKSCDQTRLYTATYTDSVLVKSASKAPVAEFVSSANLIAVDSVVRMTDLTENGVSTWKWQIFPDVVDQKTTFSFINGSSSSSKRPDLVFHIAGKYSVSLIAGNAFGKDTVVKVNYLRVQDPIWLCGKEQNHGDTVSANSGVIFDDGGPIGDYSEDLSCSLLIQPVCADKVHLDLDLIDVCRWTASGNAGDWLRIYDGTSDDDSSLHNKLGYNNGIFNPNNAPSRLGTVTANSGSMFLQFSTDDISTGEGFELRYHITPKKTTLSNVSIEGSDTVYINSVANYSSSIKAEWIDKVWDFDNDGFPDESGNLADFVWTSSGSQRITLFVDACSTKDTLYRNVQVVNPSSAPEAKFSFTTPNITPNDTLYLRDESTNGPTNYQWNISRPGAYRFLGGTNSISKHPIVQFDSLGSFSIELWVKNSLGKDSLLKTNCITVRNYCVPSVTSQLGDLGISAVSLRDLSGNTLINEASSELASYTDFSKKVRAIVTPGEQYIFSVERRSNNDKMQRSIWMDVDQDGKFSNAERLVFEKASNSLKWTDTLIFPKSSITGLSRLRIGVNAANQTDYGCGPHLSGEFEDYGLMVVADQKPPELILLGRDTVVIERCSGFTEPGFISRDNVQGLLTSEVVVSGKVDSLIQGDYILTYEVRDSAKNKTTTQRLVRVIGDTTRPEISLIGRDSIKIRVFSSYQDSGLLANDSCSGIFKIDTLSNLKTNHVGLFKIVYRVQDGAGNRDSVTRYIEVFDDEAPTFSFLENSDTLYIEVFDEYNNQQWEAKDNYDQAPKVEIIGTVNTNIPDTYYVHFSATDSSGNGPTKATRVIFVVDNTKPEIILPTKQVEIEVGRRVNLPIPQVTDNYDPNPKLEILGSYDRDFIGSYTIRYVATDFSGNVSDTVDLIVVVYDETPPNVALTGAPLLQVCRWSEYLDPGVTYSDNYNAQEELTYETSYFNAKDEPVSTAQLTQSLGYYSAYYKVVDESGNASTITRIVQVVLCDPIGLNENISSKLKVYPNPANQSLFVESSVSINHLKLIDVLGKQLLVSVIRRDDQVWKVDVSSLPEGMYYLKLESDVGTLTKGIVIQH